MASSMRDAADRATWSQMAKRWLAYAEYYEDRRSCACCESSSLSRSSRSICQSEPSLQDEMLSSRLVSSLFYRRSLRGVDG
jgi:hypothetical protein